MPVALLYPTPSKAWFKKTKPHCSMCQTLNKAVPVKAWCFTMLKRKHGEGVRSSHGKQNPQLTYEESYLRAMLDDTTFTCTIQLNTVSHHMTERTSASPPSKTDARPLWHIMIHKEESRNHWSGSAEGVHNTKQQSVHFFLPFGVLQPNLYPGKEFLRPHFNPRLP